MKFLNPIRFVFPVPILLLVALLIGQVAGVRAQDDGPATDALAIDPQTVQATLGTAFTYQGQLNDGDSPANGAYDFQFKLFDAASGGTQIGGTQSKDDLAVSGGLFTTDLDFGAGAFDGQARWLEVAVRPGVSTGAYTTLAPRRALLASPYATYSSNTRGLNMSSTGNRLRMTSSNPGATDILVGNTADGIAEIGLDASNGDFVGQDYAWIAQYDNLDLVLGNVGAERITIKPDGKVGIGTAEPGGHLNVASSNPNGALLLVSNPANGRAYIGMDASNGDFRGLDYAWIAQYNNLDLVIGNAGAERVTVKPDGKVGIGTANPAAKLDVRGTLLLDTDGDPNIYGGTGDQELNRYLELLNSPGLPSGMGLKAGGVLVAESYNYANPGKNDLIVRGTVGIGTASPQATLDIAGTTRTDVLQIDGGADLAEPFVIAGQPEPGLVVAIDPDHIGQLRIADKAYDRTVAGIISGAGGLQPGLTMQQPEVVQGETHPVALTGRVYVWADASFGAIQPGDLLTTSATPGHAMRVGDYALAQGAILGKAMSKLEAGKGLVLVLVSLQ